MTLDSESTLKPKGAPNLYPIAYGVAIVLFLLNVAIGAIQAAYASGHGADLGITPQAQAWIAVVSTIVAAALGLLPNVMRTPGKRETNYLLASQGKLPKDMEARYPTIVSVQEPVIATPLGGTLAQRRIAEADERNALP